MSNHTTYITIDSIINDYLLQSEQSISKYYKIFHICFRGMDELGLDFFYGIKAVKLPINSNMTVTLPADYRNWTKVGVLNPNGEIIPLYYNDKLTTYADLWPNRLEVTQDDTLLCCSGWCVNTWCNYWNGYAYINIYGVPSGSPFVGSFKVDTVSGVILLNENYNRDYLMLEYVSSPKEGEEYYVPVQFREALIAYLGWQDVLYTPVKTHMQNANVGLRMKNFYNERRKSIARWKPIRIYEMYQAAQEQSRMAIKT